MKNALLNLSTRSLAFVIGCMIFATAAWSQGVSTSEIRGKVVDQDGMELIGATIIATHQPTGSTYGTTTDEAGRYRLPNAQVGGPYTVRASYTGYGEIEKTGVYLALGEPQKIDFEMNESAIDLESIQVTARRGSSGKNAGAATQIRQEAIEQMPTLNRDLNDFTRLTPQATTTPGGGFSIAGSNNRYNAIYFDGAVNNDVFGLAASGTNGGQTGIAPISMDAIDQIQVVVSPYDVTYGGFAGGGINAVTKSGSNEFKGGAYYYLQNENLAGKTNTKLAERNEEDPMSLDPYTNSLVGINLSGPIIKDKLFFFVNAEIQNEEQPRPFEGNYVGELETQDFQDLREFVQNNYDYDPGDWGNKTRSLDATRIFAKINWNINDEHKLTLRHNFVRGVENDRFASNRDEINFANNGIYFPSTTNSSALELNSRFGVGASNNLIIGYTSVVDDRDPLGGNFPYVQINDLNGAELNLGSEQFSTANQLTQDVITLTNNFKLYRGNHTLTFGTHNEYMDFYNLFIRQNFGSYTFNTIDDFYNGAPAEEYTRSFSLLDEDEGVIGDGASAAAEFAALQLGFYAQDEINITNDFTLTAGIRLDIPLLLTDPRIHETFNSETLPMIEAAGYNTLGARGGEAPEGQLMWSPRLGFNYDLNGDGSSVLRGGAGIFTSRIPFVWPGGMYTNNGVTVGGFNEDQLDENPVFLPIDEQYEQINTEVAVPSGQVDLFAEDFKYPQVFRASLAFDQYFGNGWKATVEGLYTKTLNNVLYTNINSNPEVVSNWSNGENETDDRNIYSGENIDNRYSAIYLASNTNEGYTYNMTAQIEKRFAFGLNLMAAYTYGDAFAVFEGTSSQNSSQWRGAFNVDGRNYAPLGRSDFSLGSRVIASADYGINWGGSDKYRTAFSIFYNGQSGAPYSYVYTRGKNGTFASNINRETGSTSRDRSLVYIPEGPEDIELVDIEDGPTAAEQWQALDEFIEQDPYLSENRGSVAEKNSNRAPFAHVIDFKFTQNFAFDIAGKENRFQFTFDVFNVANLINSDWGVIYNNPFDYGLLGYEGLADDETTPQFTYTREGLGNEVYGIATVLSRWRGRIGIRYMFN